MAVVADTSPFEAAFMKVLGKTAPIEEMDMEKAMSAAGLVDHFDVEARGPLFALRLLCAVVFCALFAGLASGQRLQRAPNAHQEGSEAFWWESGLCPFHLCGPAQVSCADCVCSAGMHLRLVFDAGLRLCTSRSTCQSTLRTTRTCLLCCWRCAGVALLSFAALCSVAFRCA